MRSLIARLALTGLVGAALAGCGTTSGSSLPVGAFPNASGGGPVNVSNQPPTPGFIPAALIDGGLLTSGQYNGFTTAATDAQSAADAGADPRAGALANPPGSHAITFAGNGAINQSFIFTGVVPPLVLPATPVAPGQIQPVNYGAIVLFSTFTGAAGVKTPSLSIELVGGSGTTQYDVRVGCANNGTPDAVTGFLRQVCDLPAYGSPSGSYTTTYSATTKAFTAGSAGTAIVNPVVTGASGAFTPLAGPRFYILTNSPFLPTTATGNVLGIDFVYAEQGTQ